MKNILGYAGALGALVAACSLLQKPPSNHPGGTSGADGGTPSVDGGTPSADGGAAGGFTCDAGLTLCNGTTCQDISSDVKNCGSCGAACPAVKAGTMTCVSGACVVANCPIGFDICDNVCVDLRKDESCGACHNSCQDGATCIGQTCVPPGPKGCGQGTCSGCCDSGGNCVSGKTIAVCGKGGEECDSCEMGQTCQAGVCTGTPSGPKH